MSVYKQKGSKNWWYKFTWRGRQIRESTKQPNKRVAEQIEAAHKAGLAKAEVGIRDKKPMPTWREFIDNDFAPFVESRFAGKAKTLEYFRIGLKNLREFNPFANSLLDAITGDKIAAFIARRRQAGLAIASINRQLEVLRRMLKLAVKWGKVEKLLPKVEMLSGENQREARPQRRRGTALPGRSVGPELPAARRDDGSGRLRTTPGGMLPGALGGRSGWRVRMGVPRAYRHRPHREVHAERSNTRKR